MGFQGLQRTFCYKQTNQGNINDVFPLLCPVREHEWIDGWRANMVFSRSGMIEAHAVFTTPEKDGAESVWQVNYYDSQRYRIEMIKVTPGWTTAKINIHLEAIDDQHTGVTVCYRYTGLSEDANVWIDQQLEEAFNAAMKWWERSINHYLRTGEKLSK